MIIIAVQFEKTGVVNASGEGVNPNLLKNSNFSVNSQKISLVLGETIPSGTTVTLSVQIDAKDLTLTGNKRIGFEGYANNGTNTQYIGSWISGSNTSGTFSKRISNTVTTTRDFVAGNSSFGVYIQTTESGTCTISNPKIELGSTPTPWIPNETDYGAVPTQHGFAEQDNLMKVYEDYITTTEFIEY